MQKDTKLRTLLIDCDSLVYQAATAHEIEIQWEPDLWSLHAHFEPAAAQLNDTVKSLQEKLQADKVIMALSDYTEPWRKEVMATYKANRAAVRKPIIFKPLRQYVHEKYVTYQRPGLEGDDVLGILLTRESDEDGERICVSIDKDMNTLPGLHFNMGKPDEGVFERSLAQADRYHMTQTLTGDRTDGYPGCPKVGPVSAEKILGEATKVSEMWPLVVAAYKKAGLSEDVALQNARVARICRAEDFDFKTKRVLLWNPK
jgi:DNA polymerase-1